MESPAEKIILISPAHNEERTIGRLSYDARILVDKGTAHDFVVIDDHSTDATAKVAAKFGAKVIPQAIRLPYDNENETHPGKGRAFLQGLLYCREQKATIMVMVDADLLGRLLPEHIENMLRTLGPDLSMAVHKCTEGHIDGIENIIPSFNPLMSGQRAIRMNALNFLFQRDGSLSSSGPALRFFKICEGYGLETALNYRIGNVDNWGLSRNPRMAIAPNPPSGLNFKPPLRKGETQQVNNVVRTHVSIAKRVERLR